jgi:hypothetical protein
MSSTRSRRVFQFRRSARTSRFLLESDRINLGVCCFKELERSTLVVHNRSNLSRRFVHQLPPNLDKFLEFISKIEFLQPQSSLHITIKLCTTSKFVSLFLQFEKMVWM